MDTKKLTDTGAYDVRSTLQTITLLCEVSGEPCDGPRFRELILKARSFLAAVPADASAAPTDYRTGLVTLINRMRKDETRGDTVFRCGFNGAIDSVVKLIEALAAPVAPAAPAGWKLVPITPTREMRKAGLQHTGAVSATYRDMLAAAPAPTVAPAAVASRFVNLEGLRAKLLMPRAAARDERGWLAHDAYPVFDEGTRADKFLEALGIEPAFVSMESDSPDFAERWHEEGLDNCSDWTPTAPAGDGWLLLEIYDTEDGPYAMFGRDAYEAERARKLQNRREHRAPTPTVAAAGTQRDTWELIREINGGGAGPIVPPPTVAADAAAPINLEGLRKKLLTPREIVRDDQGFLTHPDFPICDEGTRADTFLEAFGIETSFSSLENDLPDLHERWYDGCVDNCSEWTPTAPEGDGWLLLEIYDTEDGPYALFGRDKYEAENALKRKRTREQHDRIIARAAARKAEIERSGQGGEA